MDVLEAFPEAGRRVPEHLRDDLRELVRAPYRIVYRITGDVLTHPHGVSLVATDPGDPVGDLLVLWTYSAMRHTVEVVST